MLRADSGKDPDAGKDWRWEEKGMTEDEMVGWYHRLNGHEFEQALGVGDGREAWHAGVHGSQGVRHNWVTKLNWTEQNCAVTVWVRWSPTHTYTTQPGSHQWTWKHYFPAIYEISALKRATYGGITPDFLVTLWFQGISGWKHKDRNSDDKHHKQKNTEHKLQSSELFQLLPCHLQRKRKQFQIWVFFHI